jgi:hypothetical protein
MATAPTRPSHTLLRPLSVHVSIQCAIGALVLSVLTGGCADTRAADKARTAGGSPPRWSLAGVNAVSRPITWAGVTAVTALNGSDGLRTVVLDVNTGRRLWERPATMAGRPRGLGVQPPAVTGAPGSAMIVALEPRAAAGAQSGQEGQAGQWRATLVARDAKTGAARWTRRVRSTFGPARCGSAVCMSEDTARPNARFVALNASNGRPVWQRRGSAEVAWSDAERVVLFHLSRRPVVAAHELRTGKVRWTYPVERAVGRGVNAAGGWAFGSTDTSAAGTLIGYLGPYQRRQGARLSPFGLFALRLQDGKAVWTRPRMLRVYPSAHPAVAPIVREVDTAGRYGQLAYLNPRSGKTAAKVTMDDGPATNGWLALPRDLTNIGFLARGKPGVMYDLRSGKRAKPQGKSWSFCAARPAPLKLKEHRGFYPIAALCPFDLANGQRNRAAEPPPAWYTGSVDGWRIWRDAGGALHGTRDARGTVPGMYGI